MRHHPGKAPCPGRNGLTAYERRAFAHAVLRAGDHTEFPAAALADGFPGHPNTAPAGLPPSGDSVKSAKESFTAGFRDEVIADSRRAASAAAG